MTWLTTTCFTTALILALAPPPAALAQERPLGSAPDTGDAKDLFGDCPRDLLRQAWTVMHPLQTGAVEVEVLNFCTTRAEAIAEFAEQQNRVGETIRALQGRAQEAQAPSAADPQTSAEEARIASNSAEIDALKARIARLEAGPDTAETRLTLDQLRAELAEKEGEQAQAGVAQDPHAEAVEAGQPDPSLKGRVQESFETSPFPANVMGEAALDVFDPIVSELDEEFSRAAEISRNGVSAPSPAPFDTSGARPGLMPSEPVSMPGTPAMQRPVELPPDGPTQWQVIHAVRKADGPWLVLFHGTREIAISVPGPTPQDPPTITWQTITEPPVTRGVGETLPDGLILKAVTDEGVTLSDPIAPEAEPVLLSFASDDDHTPGVLEWKVINLSDAAEGGS